MEFTIKVLAPFLAWSMRLEVDGDLISARIFVMARTSVNTATCINAEVYWFSIADWENDIRRHLELLSTRKDITIESHMRGPRDGSETETRVREALCRLLGISAQQPATIKLKTT